MSTTEQIKELREKTGVSVMLCKKALDDSSGDMAGALKWLQENGVKVAEKKSTRGTGAGLIEAYIHNNGAVGVLLEMRSETDFVAKNPDFKVLAHDIAMQIAATDPENVEALLEEPFIKDAGMTVTDYINSYIQKFGENIELARFERYA